MRGLFSSRVRGVVFACLAGACGGNQAAPVLGDTPWLPCPSGFHDECMTMEMPLDWNAPNGRKTPVFISRARSASPSHADLWLLQGGPGDSADVFADVVDELRAALPGFDIYTMEHRGVGQSGRLGCPDQESPSSEGSTAITPNEIPGCIAAAQAESGGLQYFRITSAADDLAHAIDETRAPGHDVFVYGVSYGTAVAIRYMQLRPNDARGIILDSVAPPGIAFFSHFSEQSDPVLHSLADLCAGDATCAARLPPDPWTSLSAVTRKVAAGACPDAKLSSAGLSGYVEGLLQQDDARVVAMALLHRIDRCEPADLTALQAFQNTLGEMYEPASPRFSQVLYWNVVFSDLWERPAPTIATLAARCNALAICSGGSLGLGEVQPLWPPFPEDPLAGQPITTSSAVLILNGTLDPQTPLANAAAFNALVTSPHKTFVAMPFSAHATIEQAQVMSVDEPACGYQVLQSFLGNPEAPDTSCAGMALPVSFASDPDQAETWFGTDNLWDNVETLDGGSGDDGGEGGAGNGNQLNADAAAGIDASSDAAGGASAEAGSDADAGDEAGPDEN
jgi:pimeloyl-ACP methyl ester carboxylesterase